jgi:S1 RNA binding domain protein
MAIIAGDVLQGRVAEVRDFGAFVWLDDNKKGLIHISEISDDYVKDIHNLVKPNQKVKIKVLSVKDDGRIELSLKQAEALDYTKPPKLERERDTASASAADEFLGEPPQFNFLDDLGPQGEFDIMLKFFKRVSEENMIDNKRNMERKRMGDKKKAKKRRGR